LFTCARDNTLVFEKTFLDYRGRKKTKIMITNNKDKSCSSL